MKIKITILFSLIYVQCLFAQDKPMNLRYGMMQVNDNLTVDQTETNVAEWLGYVISVCDTNIFRSFHYSGNISEADKTYLLNFQYPDSLLPAKGIFQIFDWCDLVKKEKGYGLKLTACSNYRQLVPINSRYFENKKIRKQLDYLLTLPVTGITYKQALAFCKWRTLTDSLRFSLMDGHYIFRLPTIEEYNLMNENLDSIPIQTKRGKDLFYGFNYRNLIFQGGDSIVNTSSGKNLVSIWQFHWSQLGLYGIQGNAAEMTSTEGVACGGSYFHFAIESYRGKTQLYDSAQPWLGLRCVAVRSK